jgi:hypothetical protein
LLFAQVLQISAVHRPKDSEIDAHGKGVGNCGTGFPRTAEVALRSATPPSGSTAAVHSHHICRALISPDSSRREGVAIGSDLTHPTDGTAGARF